MVIEDVLKFLGIFGIGSAALAWLLRSLFGHLLSRDMERFKAQLQAQYDMEVERLRNDLNKAAFEHQTRFVKLHEDRASIIKELYRKLHKAHGAFEDLLAPVKALGPGGIKEIIETASKYGREFFDYFQENRIYLDADLCKQIDTLNAVFRRAWSDFVPMGDEDYMAKGSQHLKVWAEFKEMIPPLREEIENRFRKLLGVN